MKDQPPVMNRFLISFFLLLFSSIACASWEGGTLKPMQEDFDKIRLDHIFIISGLVNEYHQKNGKYPFETEPSQIPAIAIIETEKQKETHDGKVPLFLDLQIRQSEGKLPSKPNKVDIKTIEELETELSKGLDRKITLPKDRQKFPVNKPSVYLYSYYLDVYEITAFLHHDLTFTRPLGPFYNKITLSNRSAKYFGIWNPEELLKQKEFLNFFTAPFNRGGYVIKTKQ